MPRFRDAIGYLLELRDQQQMTWFSFACDKAISASSGLLIDNDLESIWQLFTGADTSYEPRVHTPSPIASPDSPVTHDREPAFLEYLGEFHNFKKLSSGLRLSFNRPVTIVFGTNGSGKSSVCECVRILSDPEPPDSPTRNVRASESSDPTFKYKFRSSNDETWDQSQGYGCYTGSLKYYDAKIALRHLTASMQPEEIVEVAPFRLEVFDFARSICNQLRTKADQEAEASEQRLQQQVETIHSLFEGVLPESETVISELTPTKWEALGDLVEITPCFDSQAKTGLQAAQAKQQRLAAVATDEGLRAIRAELAILNSLRVSLVKLEELAGAASLVRLVDLARDVREKTAAQQALAKDVLPETTPAEDFKEFLLSTRKVFDFSSSVGKACPFCRRSLDSDEDVKDLVDKYHRFLTSRLQGEIEQTQQQLTEEQLRLGLVRAFVFKEVEEISPVLPDGVAERIVSTVHDIQASIPAGDDDTREGDTTVYEKVSELAGYVVLVEAESEKRKETLDAAAAGQTVLQNHAAQARSVVTQLRYQQRIDQHREVLLNFLNASTYWTALVRWIDHMVFPPLLRNLTIAGRDAYRDLVISEFQETLDTEYLALSGKNSAGFGVTITSRGEQQDTIVEPRVGDSPIHRVLSEGEQNIHSIALFFAELASHQADIVVLDDPATSFDYNYVSELAERLRDFVRNNPATQVIVFTHNWDFFVAVQATLNRSQLNDAFSVVVLENCDSAGEYREDIEALSEEIGDILSCQGEPTKAKKEDLSGLMRRLIETVVNKRAFNGERYQYKQKSLPVSTFHSFTKLVPLLPPEAERLRDLYANLSITEHDDPRRAYTTRSKAVFTQWLQEIREIEQALMDRRP